MGCPGCRCSNCENVPSINPVKSTPDVLANDDVEQEELEGDHNVRQLCNAELVDDVDNECASDEDKVDNPMVVNDTTDVDDLRF